MSSDGRPRSHRPPSLHLHGRRLRLGLATLLGREPRGFFIPYRYAAKVRTASYPAIEVLFAGTTAGFADVLAMIDGFAHDLASLTGDPPAPRWAQDWFPRLDGAALYAFVRATVPKRIVEVGSGHSTRFIARAVRDGGLTTEQIAIDPQPRAPLAGLTITHIAQMAEEVDIALFRALGAGDILFVDSSHIVMPGTDADRLFTTVLPALAPGVLVHVHDVFLPDPYPASWSWRGYNEQSLVACLLASGAYEPIFASHYVTTRMPEPLARSIVARLPLPKGALETSLWMRKTNAAPVLDPG